MYWNELFIELFFKTVFFPTLTKVALKQGKQPRKEGNYDYVP